MPNLNQIRLARTVGKSRNITSAMIDAGYSKTTAEKQQSRTLNSKGFKDLLEEHLPLNESFGVTKRALYATKRDHFSGEMYEDYPSQLKATDQVYKLHGLYNDSASATIGSLNITYVFRDPRYTERTGDTEQPIEIQDTELAPKSS